MTKYKSYKTKNQNRENEMEKKPRKQSYRSVKSSLELVPETSEEDRAIRIDLVDAEIEDTVEEFGSWTEATEAFDKAFTTLRQSRIYTKILNDLRVQRWGIFGRISFKSYQDLIQEHIRTIETIFREKKYTEKKSTTYYQQRTVSFGKSFSSLR